MIVILKRKHLMVVGKGNSGQRVHIVKNLGRRFGAFHLTFLGNLFSCGLL